MWRSIDGFINYQVSNIGRVRNVNTGFILKPAINTRGYQAIILRADNMPSTKMIHRLVAQEFLENDNCSQVGHINHDKLDNCVYNLRWVSNQQNSMNKTKTSSNTSSKYKGVCFYKRTNKWEVSIHINNKKKFLGYFTDEKDAAKAYNDEAIELFKDHASINEISDNEE